MNNKVKTFNVGRVNGEINLGGGNIKFLDKTTGAVITNRSEYKEFVFENNNVNGKVIELMPESKIGVAIQYDGNNKVSRLSRKTCTSEINLDGVVNGLAVLEKEYDIVYNTYLNMVTVTYANGTEEKYWFDNAYGCIAEVRDTDITLYDISSTYQFVWHKVVETGYYVESLVDSFKTSNGQRNDISSVQQYDGEWVYATLVADNKKTAEYRKDKNGNQTQTTYTYDDAKLVKEVTVDGGVEKVTRYEYSGEKLVRTIGADGIVTELQYDGEKVKKIDVFHVDRPATRFCQNCNCNPVVDNTQYGIDKATNELREMFTVASGDVNGVVYKYTAEYLTKVAGGDTEFEYTYDQWGRRKTVALNGVVYVEYEYAKVDSNDEIIATYADGSSFKIVSNSLGMVLNIQRQLSPNALWAKIFKYEYDEQNRLESTYDYFTQETVNYEYDANGDVVPRFAVDESLVANEYDGLGRLVKSESPIAKESYGYLQNGDHATAIVNSLTQQVGDTRKRTRYIYDERGNIVETRDGFNRQTAKHEYDELNRLTCDGETEYGYDTNGNILYKKTNCKKSDKVIEYKYDGDKLVSYDGKAFAYDVLGNPTMYKSTKGLQNMQWDFKNLVRYGNVKFEYDANGLRTSKKYRSTKTTFNWVDGILIGERRKTTSCDLEIGGYIYQGGHFIYAQNTDIEYKYGANGIAGFEIKTDFTEPKAYWYLKNIMGDVTAIYDNDKNLVAEYKYDAWGNCIVVDMTAEKVGTLNAIRYRGYYYDVETKLYYLKSRYYDAEIGRFVNMDDIGVIDMSATTMNGLNLYAYCFNNPINDRDPNGQWSWKKFWGTVSKNVSNFVNTVVNTVVNVVTDTIEWLVEDPIGQVVTTVTIVAGLGIASALTGGLAGTILAGAFAGSAFGAGIGGVFGGITAAITGNIGDLTSGMMWGAIGGAISGGLLKSGIGDSAQLIFQSMLGAGIYMGRTSIDDWSFFGFAFAIAGGFGAGAGANSNILNSIISAYDGFIKMAKKHFGFVPFMPRFF